MIEPPNSEMGGVGAGITGLGKTRRDGQASINWMFDVKQARQKLNPAFGKLACQN